MPASAPPNLPIGLLWSVWGFSQCLTWESVTKYKRTDWKPALYKACAGKKGVLILLCSNCCREVVFVGGSRTCSGLYQSICRGFWCQVLLLWLRMVLFATPLDSSHTYTLFIWCCRQFTPLLCYAFRGHAFKKWRERANSIQTVGLPLNSYSCYKPPFSSEYRIPLFTLVPPCFPALSHSPHPHLPPKKIIYLSN